MVKRRGVADHLHMMSSRGFLVGRRPRHHFFLRIAARFDRLGLHLPRHLALLRSLPHRAITVSYRASRAAGRA